MENRKTIQEKDNYLYGRLQSPITGIFNANQIGNKREMSNNDPNGETDIKDNPRTQQNTSQEHDEDHINNTTGNITDFPSRKDEFNYQIEAHLSKEELDERRISPSHTTNLLSTERFLGFLNYCSHLDKATPDQSKVSQSVEPPHLPARGLSRMLTNYLPSSTIQNSTNTKLG